MHIQIRVKPGSKEERVEQEQEGYIVRVRARAENGKANKAVQKLLAHHFHVQEEAICIKTRKGRTKLVEIVGVENEV